MKRYSLLFIMIVVIFAFFSASCATLENKILEETSFLTSNESNEYSEYSEILFEDNSIMINKKENIDLASIQNFNKAVGGYAIEIDGTLFFSNPSDGNSLYKESLNDGVQTKIGYLNSEFRFTNFQRYEDSLFYMKKERLENIIETEFAQIAFSNTIVCMNLVNNEEKMILNANPVIDFVVYDDILFYSTYSQNKKCEFWQFELTHQTNKKLADFDYPMSMQASNNKVYLSFDETLVVYDINRKTTSFHLLPQNSFAVLDDGIIYIDSDSLHLYKLKYDHELMDFDYENVMQLCNEKVETFNIYGDDLIFSDVKTSDLYYVNGSTKEKQKIGSGDSPIVISNGIVFINDYNKMEIFKFYNNKYDQ